VEALRYEASGRRGGARGVTRDEQTAAVPAGVRASLDEETAVLAEARGLIASDDVQGIPTDLRDAINNLNGIIAEASEAQLVAGLAATVESARASAAIIEDSAQGVPAIFAELEKLAATAGALELDTLVSEATNTLNSIDRLVGSQSTQDLPASLSAALDQMRLFLAEVREGGAVTNVNATLASASEAAQAIEEAAASFPALAAQARALVSQSDAVLQTYGDRSRFNSELLAALRDIQEAADSVSDLARAIQRNPNSLLTGR